MVALLCNEALQNLYNQTLHCIHIVNASSNKDKTEIDVIVIISLTCINDLLSQTCYCNYSYFNTLDYMR